MTPLNDRRLLLSVVKLTETADVRAFELSLIETLHQFISAKTIQIYKIHDDPPHKFLLLTAPSDEEAPGDQEHEPILLESNASFTECLAAESRVVINNETGSGIRIIHPLMTSGGIVGFLLIECDTVDQKDEDLVSILLVFYRNYVSLLTSSQRDKLTGLLNRKTFDERMLNIIARLRLATIQPDGRGAYCLAILDVDHFKRVNDRFGHLYGDEVLLLFARLMIEAFRGADLLFRVGGEEFVVVLKDVDLKRALAVLERFRQMIESYPFPQVGQITASIGTTEITGSDLPSTALDRADKALYYAKNNGRNQVRAFESLVKEKKLDVSAGDSDVELF